MSEFIIFLSSCSYSNNIFLEGENNMQSDLQIAQAIKLTPITKIAADIGINEDELEQYGHYKAKI